MDQSKKWILLISGTIHASQSLSFTTTVRAWHQPLQALFKFFQEEIATLQSTMRWLRPWLIIHILEVAPC